MVCRNWREPYDLSSRKHAHRGLNDRRSLGLLEWCQDSCQPPALAGAVISDLVIGPRLHEPERGIGRPDFAVALELGDKVRRDNLPRPVAGRQDSAAFS